MLTNAKFAARAFLGCFGLLAGLTGLIAALYPEDLKAQGWPYLAGVVVGSATYAVLIAWPREKCRRSFIFPRTEIAVRAGDLFERQGHLVVGMCDTFDTSVPEVINPRSVQAQLLRRLYDDDTAQLDAELRDALSAHSPICSENRTVRPVGKLDRFPVGTVAVLEKDGRRIFCSAYSRLSNSNVAQATVDTIWNSLSELWISVRAFGELQSLSMPVVGSDLARLTSQVSQDDLIRLITLSFLTASRESPIAHEFSIIVHRNRKHEVDFRKLSEFLSSLA